MLLEKARAVLLKDQSTALTYRIWGEPRSARTTAEGNRTVLPGQRQRCQQAQVTAVQAVSGSQWASWAPIPKGSWPGDGAPPEPRGQKTEVRGLEVNPGQEPGGPAGGHSTGRSDPEHPPRSAPGSRAPPKGSQVPPS